MIRRYLTFSLLSSVLALVLIFPVQAAEQSFAPASIMRLQVDAPEVPAPPPGIWARVAGWLGIRRPVRPRLPIGTTITVQASAYASSPLQTDSTPCITAAGTTVRPGVVASNFLPLGTLLDINGQPFIVEDRMNPRYAGKFLDVWFTSTRDALQFGRRKLVITVTGYGDPGQQLTDQKKLPVLTQLAHLLATRVVDVNRHDVDCSEGAVALPIPTPS